MALFSFAPVLFNGEPFGLLCWMYGTTERLYTQISTSNRHTHKNRSSYQEVEIELTFLCMFRVHLSFDLCLAFDLSRILLNVSMKTYYYLSAIVLDDVVRIVLSSAIISK